jgi:hypothetical protein
VDALREDVGKFVERQRRLVGEHARLLRPEPQLGELLVLAGWIVDDTVDPAPDPPNAAELDVSPKELVVVARGGGLSRGEQAILAGGHCEELVLARLSGSPDHHARI